MARRRQQDQTEHPFEDDRHDDDHQEFPPRKRRWPWVLLILLVIVFLLPNAIAMTSLKQKAVDYALADFKGKVNIQSASFGWLQPIRLSGIEAVDEQGQPLLSVSQIKTSRSLLSFLVSSDYGQVDIQQPIVQLQLRPDGSNLEDACAAWLATDPNAQTEVENLPAKSAAISLPKMQINVINGLVSIASTTEPNRWQIEELNVQANTDQDIAAVVLESVFRVAAYSANQTGAASPTGGPLTIQLQVDPGSRVVLGNSILAAIDTDALPLSIAGPFLQRVIGPARTSGSLNAQLQVAYDAATAEARVAVKQATVTKLGVVAPEILGDDHLRLQQITATGDLAISPSMIVANRFQASSDVGTLSANGSFSTSQIASLAGSNPETTGGQLFDTPFQMDGQLDLAKVAAILPSTLQLQEGIEIQSGVVSFQAASRIENDARRLIVNFDTANLAAQRGGESIVWQKPLRIVGTIRESGSMLALEELRCESDFLQVSGKATLETGSFAATGSLNELMKRASQFVDLGGLQLAGDLDGQLAWQTNRSADAASTTSIGTATLQDRPIQLVGQFTINRPQIQLPGMAAWGRPQLIARVSAAGQATSDQRVQVDQAGLQMDIGTEQAILTLAAPIADAFTANQWQFNSQLSGSVAGWLAHLQNFVDLGEVQADGQLQAQAITTLTSADITLQDVQYEVQQLQWLGHGLTIREQQTSGVTNVHYDLNSGRTTLADTTLSSNSISLGGQRITIDVADNIQVNGDLAFRADMSRVADWLALSPTPDSVFWFGDGEGTVLFASDANGIGARVTTDIRDMIAATRGNAASTADQLAAGQSPMRTVSTTTAWSELWREANVNVTSDLVLSNDFDAIAFQNTSLKSTTLNADVSGQLSELSGVMLADIEGQWTPDWQKLNALLAAYTGNAVQMTGQGSHPISVRGPLFADATGGQPAPWISPLLTAATQFDWQQASVAGLPIGAGQLRLDVRQGIANVNTGDIAFSQGVIRLQPQIDLRTAEPVLYLPKGTIADRVTLTPETAQQWLKFVAPLAADATSAKGTFSLSTEGARVPLLDPMTMQMQGNLVLSDIVIGAGPVAQQLLSSAQQLRTLIDPGSGDSSRDLNTWLTLEEQTVPVSVQDGRVFHEGVKIRHKDLLVQTRGSVGLDQTLDLVAEIPIADDWIEGKKHLESLRGHVISIPVTGTASAPQLDQRALQQLSSQLVKQAASGAINKAFGEKVAPKLNEYQQQLNSKVNEQVNKLQNKLQQKVQQQATETFKQQAEDKLKGELIKGFGNLFGN